MANTICLGYMVANEEPLLNLSLHTMLQFPWIRLVVVLDTTTDRPAELIAHRRLIRYGRDYGLGFDRSPAEGGFDEIAARNDLLRHMRQQAGLYGCDWLLLCDADEFYLPHTICQISRADRAGKRASMFECWHACDLARHRYFKEQHHANYGMLLNDPHPRAMRSSCDRLFEANPWLDPNTPNKTIHCLLRFPNHEMHQEHSLNHVHVKHMFKEPPDLGDDVQPLPNEIEWPEMYRRAWNREWALSQGYDSRYPLKDGEILFR